MADQLARGIFANFGPGEHPFDSPNGMEENLRLINDHLAPCAISAPVAVGAPLPSVALPGAVVLITDGRYAVRGAAAEWTLYPAAFGIQVPLVGGGDIYLGTGSGWLSMRSAMGVDALESALQNGISAFGTRAELEANLDYPDQAIAWVLNDATPANNLIYRKVGPAGAGSWVIAADSLLSQLLTAVTPSKLVADASNNVAMGPESLGRFSNAGLGASDNNTAIGHAAGGSLAGGDRNTDIGRAAGRANTTGSDNVRVGFGAGLLKATGNENTVVGASAAANSSAAVSKVTVIGALAGNNIGVSEATIVGAGAGTNLTTGARFSAFGAGAGTGHTTQDGCTFVGWSAGVGSGQTYTHHNQTAIGHQAICDWENQVSLGDSQVRELRMFGGAWARQYVFGSTIIGKGAGHRSSQGHQGSVVIGYEAGVAGNTSGDWGCVYIGYLSGNTAVNNQASVFVGTNAGQHATNVNDSVAIGSQAGRWLGRHEPTSWEVPEDEAHIKAAGSDVTQGLPLPSTLVGSTFVGKNAGRYVTIGANNTGIGDSALGFTTTGQQNVALGYVCGEGNVTGSFNAFGGQGVRVYQRSGDHNALWGYAIGAGVGSFGTYPAGGSFNAIVGSEAAYSWAGSDVAAVGYRAFHALTGGSGGDVGLGLSAGRSVQTGGGNVFIGKSAGHNAGQDTDVQNSIAIGADTYTTKNNQVVLGNSSATEFVLGGVVLTRAKLEALIALVS